MSSDQSQYTLQTVLPLHTAQASQQIDALAITQLNVTGFRLMHQAATAVLVNLFAHYPHARSITCLCGKGNNAGDAYLVAALALGHQLDVTCISLCDPNKLTGDAARAFAFAQDNGIQALPFEQLTEPDLNTLLTGADVIVDGLLGTGLKGEVTSPFRDAIEQCNKTATPVIAVDLPSGLNADTGAIHASCIKANHTVTFITRKQGLYTALGPEYAGQISYDALGVPIDIHEQVDCHAALVTEAFAKSLRPTRPAHAHKHMFGHAMLAGGADTMSGAIILAALAASQTGCGLLSCWSETSTHAPLLVQLPECMLTSTMPDFERFTALACGPGLAQTQWSNAVFHACWAAEVPLVLDADGLNLLAQQWHAKSIGSRQAPLILTPHVGEAARLLDLTTQQIQQDRFSAVKALGDMFHAVVVLKGNGSLIYDGSCQSEVFVCPYGNPGMAKAGMGDALTGLITGYLAQGLPAWQAAILGVVSHSLAGDIAATIKGQAALKTTDLISQVPHLFKPSSDKAPL